MNTTFLFDQISFKNRHQSIRIDQCGPQVEFVLSSERKRTSVVVHSPESGNDRVPHSTSGISDKRQTAVRVNWIRKENTQKRDEGLDNILG